MRRGAGLRLWLLREESSCVLPLAGAPDRANVGLPEPYGDYPMAAGAIRTVCARRSALFVRDTCAMRELGGTSGTARGRTCVARGQGVAAKACAWSDRRAETLRTRCPSHRRGLRERMRGAASRRRESPDRRGREDHRHDGESRDELPHRFEPSPDPRVAHMNRRALDTPKPTARTISTARPIRTCPRSFGMP